MPPTPAVTTAAHDDGSGTSHPSFLPRGAQRLAEEIDINQTVKEM